MLQPFGIDHSPWYYKDKEEAQRLLKSKEAVDRDATDTAVDKDKDKVNKDKVEDKDEEDHDVIVDKAKEDPNVNQTTEDKETAMHKEEKEEMEKERKPKDKDVEDDDTDDISDFVDLAFATYKLDPPDIVSSFATFVEKRKEWEEKQKRQEGERKKRRRLLRNAGVLTEEERVLCKIEQLQQASGLYEQQLDRLYDRLVYQQLCFTRLRQQQLRDRRLSSNYSMAQGSIELGPNDVLLEEDLCNAHHRPKRKRSGSLPRCQIMACPEPSLPPTRFCFSHILHDPNQLLFPPCSHPLRSSPSSLCTQPVLKGSDPSYCSSHLPKS